MVTPLPLQVGHVFVSPPSAPDPLHFEQYTLRLMSNVCFAPLYSSSRLHPIWTLLEGPFLLLSYSPPLTRQSALEWLDLPLVLFYSLDALCIVDISLCIVGKYFICSVDLLELFSRRLVPCNEQWWEWLWEVSYLGSCLDVIWETFVWKLSLFEQFLRLKQHQEVHRSLMLRHSSLGIWVLSAVTSNAPYCD